MPATPALAVLLSGLMIYGLQPGPLLFEKQPQFVWTVIALCVLPWLLNIVLGMNFGFQPHLLPPEEPPAQ